MIELIDGMTENRYNLNYMDVYKEIDRMMASEEGIKQIYYNKQDRLYASNPMCLIMFYDEPIGFINLVQEDIDNIKFLDQAIIKKYRNMGYGKDAIKLLGVNYCNEYIIGETLVDNVAANRLGNDIACFVHHNRYSNYYLFQPERFFSFIQSPEYIALKERDNKVLTKRLHQ